MTAPGRNAPLLLSVLDRLLDDGPASAPASGQASRLRTVADLRAAIQRDLEDLLNTRRRVIGWPEDLTELNESILDYGVPDIRAENLGSDIERRRLVDRIEAAIRRWEPRFSDVSVTLVPNGDSADRTLKFRIEALVRADPLPEQLVFDSEVDPASYTVTVGKNSLG